MNPLQLIENGLKDGNLELINNGFEKMTGRSIGLPNLQSNNLDVKHLLLKIQSLISDFLSNNYKENNNHETIEQTANNVSYLDDNQITPISKDVGGIRLITDEPDEKEVANNKLKALNKIKIRRNKYELYDVECNECHETFKSNIASSEFGQKCKKCLGQKKSRFNK